MCVNKSQLSFQPWKKVAKKKNSSVVKMFVNGQKSNIWEKKKEGGGEDCKKNEFWKAVREEFSSQ